LAETTKEPKKEVKNEKTVKVGKQENLPIKKKQEATQIKVNIQTNKKEINASASKTKNNLNTQV
jgi:hypothetical protein